MATIAPTLVFRTFPATTASVDGAPVDPSDPSVSISAGDMDTIVQRVAGKIPVFFEPVIEENYYGR